MASYSDLSSIDTSDIVRESVTNDVTGFITSHNIITTISTITHTAIDLEGSSITVGMRLVGSNGDVCHATHTNIICRGYQV